MLSTYLQNALHYQLTMLKMITDPDYIKSSEHREAGLKGQLNIEIL